MEVPLPEREDRKEGSRVFFLKAISAVGLFIVPAGHLMRQRADEDWMCSSEAGLTWELRVTSESTGTRSLELGAVPVKTVK